MRAGASTLPSGERLAAAVVDFLVLLIPQVVIFIILLGHVVGRYAKFLRAHPHDNHLATTPGFHTLSHQFSSAGFHFLIVSEVVTAIYLIGMYLGVGTTLGKMAMGLRITRADGNPMRPSDAVLRSLVFWVPLLIPVIGFWIWILVYVGGTITLMARPDHRGPEDMLAHTIVVRKDAVGHSLDDLLGRLPNQMSPGSPPAPLAARGGHLPGWDPVAQPPPDPPRPEGGAGSP